MDEKCVEVLTKAAPYESVFVYFRQKDEMDVTSQHILECLSKKTIVSIVTKIDEQNTKVGLPTNYTLEAMLYHKNNSSSTDNLTVLYAYLLRGISNLNLEKKGETKKYDSFATQIKNKSIFQINGGVIINFIDVLFLFQIYFLLNNLKKFYPKTFTKNLTNSQSLIYQLLYTPFKSGEIIADIRNTIYTSLIGNTGFTSYHNLILPAPMLNQIDTNQLALNCIKLLGLYISYQINKNDEGKMVPNQPFYPTLSGKVQGELMMASTSMMPISQDITKAPFKPDLVLNTFPVAEDIKFEVAVNKLSDLSDDRKYEPVTNLITLEELNEMLNDDNFIFELVKSEIQLMYYKLTTYNLMKSDISLNLKSNLDEKVASALTKKLKTVNQMLTNIEKRAKDIKNKSKSVQINDKRRSLENILNDPNNGIKSIKGESRENIRRYLYSQIYIFSKAPELFVKNFINYTLMGPAGSGKTKTAGVLAYVYNNLGILASSNPKGKFMIVTASDLVAGYIGQTATKTREILEKTLEGVLLIDEAYQVSGCPSGDTGADNHSQQFSKEAIAELVNYIDKNVGLSVIIAAGYEDKIVDCFLASNEGMKRRFPNNIRLLDYTGDDLYTILIYNIVQKLGSNPLTKSQLTYIQNLITAFNKDNYEGTLLFNNQAGDMLNLSANILDDFVLLAPTGYVATNINTSFQKFFANKGIFINFGGDQSGGMCQINHDDNVRNIYDNIYGLQRGMYKLLV